MIVKPFWTPDGKRIVFGWNPGGPNDLFSRSADGSGELEPPLTSDVFKASSPPSALNRAGGVGKGSKEKFAANRGM